MQVQSAQEAMFIACEMERGAVQLYERALSLMTERQQEPLYSQLAYMLEEERNHLKQFRALYAGMDAELEHTLTLSAVAAAVLFDGGLMGAVRAGLLSDERGMLRFAAESEEKAAATYRAFATQCPDSQTRDMLNGIAAEEDKHLQTLRQHQELL